MTTEQFAYWLQGFSEIHGAPPNAEQWEMIKEHLQTCFVKVTGGGVHVATPAPGTLPTILRDLNKQNTWSWPTGDQPAITC